MSSPSLRPLVLGLLLVLACSSSSSSSLDSGVTVDAVWPWAGAADAGDGSTADAPTGDTGAAMPDGPGSAADLGKTSDGPLTPPSDGPSGPADGPAAAPDGSAAACARRTGGALVTLSICQGEKVTVWITNPAFITEAIAKKGMKGRIPGFELIDGRDCDPAWSWHVNPASPTWADLSTEVCDGCPHLVEQDKAAWLKLGRYCPWATSVVDVVDRR
jgi:hypothetical protein